MPLHSRYIAPPGHAAPCERCEHPEKVLILLKERARWPPAWLCDFCHRKLCGCDGLAVMTAAANTPSPSIIH